MRNIFALISSLLLFCSCGNTATEGASLASDSYGLPDLYRKATDNSGKGNAALAGTRNFRVVLKGVMYRGGKTNPAGNSNPMTTQGLTNLCKEGFSTAVYLYTTNFGRAPKSVNCGGKTLQYKQMPPGKELLGLIHKSALSNRKIYTHCYNGWHASGLISAYSLIQFCGWSNNAAIAYWNKNVDGNNGSQYDGIRAKIRAFKPYPEVTLEPEKKRQLCFPF